MKISEKPAFKRVYKKLTRQEKTQVDDAIHAVIKNPKIGELKKGDLAGLFVYKFKVHQALKLLAYTWEPGHIVLVAYGTHENFYRDLKR